MKRIAAVLLVTFMAFTAVAEDQAVCAVCGPREGAGFEPVRARATYQGKEYAFCSLECKVAFLKDPQSFLITDEGKPAPAFTLQTLDGSRLSLSDYRGKVVLLDFWGTFCPPCVAALPELQALQAKYGPRGFTVIGVTVDDRERRSLVEKATSRAKVTYPLVEATPEVWSAYKVNALPSLVLVGRDGRIVKRYGGEADKVAMLAEIEKAIAQ